MTITRQKVVGILRAKGFKAATYAEHRVKYPGYHVSRWGTSAGWVVGVTYRDWSTYPTPVGELERMTQSYLAALSAAGIQGHLGDDGRTVVVKVEQGGQGGPR